MESSEPKPKSTIRRWRLALASVLIAGLLLYFLLPTNAGAYRAMPAQSSLVLEGTGLLRAQMLCEKTADPQWREWLHSKLFKTCFADADAAIKLLAHDPGLLRAFAKNKCLAAFTLHPSDSLHALFALELDERINLENLLKTSKLASKFFPHQFRGNTIFNVHLSKTEQIEVAVRGKILLCSRRAILVEDALAQLDNARNWWADRPYLNDLPPSPLRIHLRPGAMAEQFRNSMNARWRSLPDLLARNVEWLGMSWNGESVKILAETKGFVQGLASWGKASDNEIFKILPDNTAFMARAGLKDIPAFFNEIGAGRNTDFDQYVLPWLGSEAALVVTEPLSPALTADRLLLLAVRDSARAVSSLRAFGKDRGALPGASGAYQMFELWGFQNSSDRKSVV